MHRKSNSQVGKPAFMKLPFPLERTPHQWHIADNLTNGICSPRANPRIFPAVPHQKNEGRFCPQPLGNGEAVGMNEAAGRSGRRHGLPLSNRACRAGRASRRIRAARPPSHPTPQPGSPRLPRCYRKIPGALAAVVAEVHSGNEDSWSLFERETLASKLATQLGLSGLDHTAGPAKIRRGPWMMGSSVWHNKLRPFPTSSCRLPAPGAKPRGTRRLAPFDHFGTPAPKQRQ